MTQETSEACPACGRRKKVFRVGNSVGIACECSAQIVRAGRCAVTDRRRERRSESR